MLSWKPPDKYDIHNLCSSCPFGQTNIDYLMFTEIYIHKEDKNGKELYTGDRIKVQVKRCSSSMSTWCQIINRYHGWYWVNGIIFYNTKDCKFEIMYDDKEIKKLEKPIGKEKFKQHVEVYHGFEYLKSEQIEKVKI